MKVLVSILFLAVAVASASNSTVELEALPDSIITNGFTAAEGRAPYIVYLQFRNSFCGGSILGHTWVVTASHCTKPYNSVTIHYGSLIRARGQIVHTVRGANNIINHSSDDIALIRTPHVSYSNTIRAVRLPSINERNRYENEWALACGWGQTSSGSAANQLQCVNLQVISNAQCRRTYSAQYSKDQILCVATPGGKSICFGDSGGPLVHNNLLIGVSNFVSARGCTAGDPSGFARVTSHLNWIRQHTSIAY
ncbi:hypothetical protein ACLKA7_017270 [Drosophila subpalustris]